MNALITDEQRALLLANGRESSQNPDFDPAPVVKLFTPDAGATWLISEIDPDDCEGDRARLVFPGRKAPERLRA